MPRTNYAIALGSNRRHHRHGSPARVIQSAIQALRSNGVTVERISPIINTVAIGPAGRGFANAAAIIGSDLSPPALLALLKRMERAFGRRRGQRWGARVLDLDIILWSGGDWPTRLRQRHATGLVIPHRSMAERAFVIDPLIHIAPGWRSPANGLTVRQMHQRLQRRRPRG